MKTMSSMAVMGAAILVCSCTKHNLSHVMHENGFTAITPPQTGWTPGTIVEIVAGQEEFPVMRITPEAAGLAARNHVYNSDVPDFQNDHEDKLDLAVGMAIPGPIKADLNAKFKRAQKYSVKCQGNKIYRILIDEYATNVFQGAAGLAEKYGGRWSVPLLQNKLYYLNELWCSSSLEYKFYDSGNLEVSSSIPVSQLQVNLVPGYSWSSSGTLMYTSQSGVLVCLGYKARPLIRGTGKNFNEIILQSAGPTEAKVASPGAHADPWE